MKERKLLLKNIKINDFNKIIKFITNKFETIIIIYYNIIY